jgi:hypothetical protein
MRIKTRTSFWDSAVLRESSIATFAVGTSKGLRIARQTPSQWIFPPHIYEDEHATAIESRLSVNAVDWINNDIVVAGMRSKAVVLHDTRVRHGGVFRMRHDNPVFQVKKVDDYRILAGGPQSVSPISLHFFFCPRLDLTNLVENVRPAVGRRHWPALPAIPGLPTVRW